jgi:CheY-like chemotaxis protein
MKILAVDDDEFILELLTEALNNVGFSDITLATSAEDAIERVGNAASPYECILLDIQMPGMNGIELCQWLRRQDRYKETSIIMITSLSDKANIDRAFSSGASDYVTKPFDLTELGSRVRIAQRQLQTSKRLSQKTFEVKAIGAQLDNVYRVDLSDAVHITDVAGVIDMLALENYLLRMQRGDLFATSLLAFRIVNVADLYARCQGNILFRDILADTVEAVINSMHGINRMTAYAGNGIFVSLVSDFGDLDVSELETECNQLLAGLDVASPSGEPVGLRIKIGARAPFGMAHSGKAALNQLHNVIGDLLMPSDAPSEMHQSEAANSPWSLGAFSKTVRGWLGDGTK